jgi:PPIC-type PPIASE domain
MNLSDWVKILTAAMFFLWLNSCDRVPDKEPQQVPSEVTAGWIDSDPVMGKEMIARMKIRLAERGLALPGTQDELLTLQMACLREIARNRIIVREGQQLSKNDEPLTLDMTDMLGQTVDLPDGFEALELERKNWLDRASYQFQLMTYAGRISDHLSQSVSPSEELIEAAYQDEIETFTIPMELELCMIRVSDQSLADDIREKLKKRWNFEKLAERFSNLTGEGANGKQCRKSITEFPESFAGDLRTLSLKRTSDVLTSYEGYYIFKIYARHPKRILPLKEVRDTLIEELVSRERSRRFNSWMEMELSQTDIQMGTPVPLQEIDYEALVD